MGWIETAPKRSNAHVEAASITTEDESVYPALVFAFHTMGTDPVNVVLVGREMDLRRFQIALDKAITDSLRHVRGVL